MNQISEISVQCRGNRIYKFVPAKTVLFVIDFQKEFFIDDTGECIGHMQSILPRVARIIALARYLGCKVVHTRESYKPDLTDVHAYRQSLDYVGKPGPLGHHPGGVALIELLVCVTASHENQYGPCETPVQNEAAMPFLEAG